MGQSADLCRRYCGSCFPLPSPYCSRTHRANFFDFGLGDVAVLVHVEQPEGPLQLHGGGLARGRHVESDDVLFEIQRAVRVGVKGAEDVLGIRLGVAVREELAVDLLKLLFGDAF